MEYDALLLLSFGGPEQPADVLPFLENVTHGRGVPAERLARVAEQYERRGGRSPINDQNRELRSALAATLAVPVYWGNRFWHPLLPDVLRVMRDDGVRRAAVFVTSPYAGVSSCLAYRRAMSAAREQVGDGAPLLTKLRHFFDHPGFVDPMVDRAVEASSTLPAGSRLVFVAHSVPVADAAVSGPAGGAYVAQVELASGLVARGAGAGEWDLAWCSRSGPPEVAWLEPDVGDHLEALAAAEIPGAAVVPIGFVSDHMEVVHDLDAMAAARAAAAGLSFERAATVGTDPRFVAMVRELLGEREEGLAPRRLAPGPWSWEDCPVGCCGALRPEDR